MTKKSDSHIFVSRRSFIANSLGLACLGVGSYFISNNENFRGKTLDAASRWNDSVQSVIFSPDKLAPTYNLRDITSPFPSNLFYPHTYAPDLDHSAWSLSVSGRTIHKAPITLQELRGMPQESQITRLICIEGWSAVGQWSGVPLRYLLEKIGADTNNTFVRLDCADGYFTSIDVASAMHPQTLLALEFLGKPLSREYGAPLRLRIPTKLGFKNAKYLTGISVHKTQQGGYWEDQGYNWFGGL